MFGEKISDSIIKENKNNCAHGITSDILKSKWSEICDIINTIPTYENLKEIYQNLGVKSTLKDIAIDENKLNTILE